MKLSGASDSTIMQVGRWSSLTYGNETQWRVRQHNYAGREMVVIDVPHIYPFTNRSTDDRSGMEDVNGVHISKCRIINRVCQLNKVGRQH